MNNKTTLERLTDARDYLTDPDHFITGLRWDQSGTRNCALGAIERAYGFKTWPRYTTSEGERFEASDTPEIKILATAARELNLDHKRYDLENSEDGTIVAGVNNFLGHEPTLQMFNRAIELAVAA